jgi:hypothetical protein
VHVWLEKACCLRRVREQAGASLGDMACVVVDLVVLPEKPVVEMGQWQLGPSRGHLNSPEFMWPVKAKAVWEAVSSHQSRLIDPLI